MAWHEHAAQDRRGRGGHGLDHHRQMPDVASHHPGMPPSLAEIEAHSMMGFQSLASESHVALPTPRRLASAAQSKSLSRLRQRRSSFASPLHLEQPPPMLKEVEGEYSVLIRLPEPRILQPNASPLPILRWGAVPYWVSRQTLGKFYRRIKRFCHKALVHICWLLSLLWWQLLTAVLVTFLALGPNRAIFGLSTQAGEAKIQELVDIHRIYGGVIGFIVAFRMHIAYQAYMEGRRLVGQLQNGLREVVLECYAALPQADDEAQAEAKAEAEQQQQQQQQQQQRKEQESAMVLCITPPDSSSSAAASSSGAIPRTEGEEAEAEGGGSSSSSCTDAEANAAAAAAAAKDDDEALLLLDAAREVRRLCNVVFAFVRQDVREAQHGFLPGSDMERVRFVSHKNYYMDPCRPRLWDLLTEEETTRYAKVPSRMRPCAVASEIMRHAAVIERHCKKAGRPAPSVNAALKAILVVHESMARVNNCPLPYPFLCILHISTFLFIYSTPFLYLAHTDCPITLVSLFLLIFSYYGLLEIGLQIERPYSYCHGSFNLELESFALQSHDDLLEVARLWSEDDESFVPEYLAFVS